MGEPSARPRGWGWIYTAAWLLYLILYLTALLTGDVPLPLAVRGALSNVIPEALLGVLLLRLPARLRWPEGGRGRFFAAHAGWLVAFVVAATAGWLTLWWLDRVLFERVWSAPFDLRILPWRVLIDLLVYGALVGAGYAWHHAATSRALSARVARAEALRARAELEALRSQLNPHFVLNTLHALLGLVRREPEVAEQALERLGDLLRHSLRIQRDGVDEVAVREEWGFVRGYLELEQLRLGERLQSSCTVAEDALDAAVPSFALQTLVENAVRHGVAPRAGGGRLAIAVRRGDGIVRLEVENDAPPGAAVPREGRGIGLRLLRERLAALYDEGALLSLEASGGVFRAALEVPQRAAAETE